MNVCPAYHGSRHACLSAMQFAQQGRNAQIADSLTAFCRFHTADPQALIKALAPLPGHAGLSFKFLLEYHAQGEIKHENLVIRLAPAGVRPMGPADVARQGRIMASLRETEVPVPPVRWFGEETHWFGVPYCVVGFVGGPGLARGDEALTPQNALSCARDALSVMAKLHEMDWHAARSVWGEPVTASAELTRIDQLFARPMLEPALVNASAPLGKRLRSSMIGDGPVACIHGDFQWTNLLFAGERVAALLDWELAAVGPTLLDLAWLCLFSDAASWDTNPLVPSAAPPPAEILALYEEITGRRLEMRLTNWFRALAAYRFGAITGFNLMLHRRGKRIDPTWETLALSVMRMFKRALELCP
jgi:aminoglycoside phosphotransferase (APT) family kinase protein